MAKGKIQTLSLSSSKSASGGPRINKADENRVIKKFVELIAEAKQNASVEQVWFGLTEFKRYAYGIDAAKITEGREAVLEKYANKHGLTFLYSLEGDKIGFISCDDDNNALSRKILKTISSFRQNLIG